MNNKHTSKEDKNKVSKLASKMAKKNKRNSLANQSMRYEISHTNGCIGKSGTHTCCHEFTGPKTNDGYGQTTIKGKNYTAHRAAYTHFIGDVPAGKDVGHICNNRSCINPDHLTALSRSENVKQSYAENNNRKKPVKLDNDKINELLSQTNKTIKELAVMFNVSIVTVNRIIRRNKNV